ncbi:MAG: hypothetical protein LBT11_05325 [Treponema sp.]|jgi:hypothetical protein|nr:hypothetical protein [Treponema sp.]
MQYHQFPKQAPRLLLAAFLCLAGAAGVGGAETSTIDISIRFFDQRIYYLEELPIYVQVTINNKGPGTFRFKLAEERAFSLDFDVRSLTNRTVEPALSLVRKRSSSQQVFFREITVETGESFSFVEDIHSYATLTQSGSYIVQAKLYPELIHSTQAVPLESNRLSLNIRPPLIPGPGGVPLQMDVATNALLVREKLPPDEVIRYTLEARQKEQWERFFLYLDLEALISRDPVRSRQWLAESEEGRQRMIERYRTDLQNALVDGDIASIPMNFEIERTVYNTGEGTVSVLERFKTGDYVERKRYTYYLRRKDDVWTITDYTVVNLGTE